jgi:hypothetical protein
MKPASAENGRRHACSWNIGQAADASLEQACFESDLDNNEKGQAGMSSTDN